MNTTRNAPTETYQPMSGNTAAWLRLCTGYSHTAVTCGDCGTPARDNDGHIDHDSWCPQAAR